MTTELEQEFFKVFGIEPECSIEVIKNVKCVEKKCKDCIFCMKLEITAEILLELICILGTAIRHFKIPPKLKLEQLKYHILRNCINEQEGIYTHIQQLFKEEE